MNHRKTLLALATVPLLALAACSEDNDTTAPESPRATSTTAQKPAVHKLDETITLGNTVTISDIELSTKGCMLEDKDPEKFIKFQMIATVENGTNQEIQEILWPSDFRYKDSKGMTSTNIDNSDAFPCSTEEQSEFNSMGPGEKRRASITLVAPKNTVEMTYKTDLIPGTKPVTWNVKDEIKKLKPEASDPSTEVATSAPQPAPEPEAAPQPQQNTQQQDSVFTSPGNGYQCPGTDAFVNNPADCTSQNLGGDPAYDSMYPGGYPREPSPWVQGQIDWSNCKDAGYTDAECREMLN